MPPLVTFNSSDLRHDIDNLRRGFAQLPQGLARIHIRAAMRRILKPYEPLFRAAAPRDTGRLRRSVTTITDFDGYSGRWRSRVGFGRSKTKQGHHAILADAGTKERKKRNGQHCGRMPARRFASGLAHVIRTQGAFDMEKEMTIALERAQRALPIYANRTRSRGRR